MRKNIPIEFIYQIFSLILVIILVHGFYVSVIRPNADAELRAEQKDSDSLPDYDVLDPILAAFIEKDLSVDEIEEQGFDRDTVIRVLEMVRRNEYKRRQAPVGVRISRRGFGRDRRYPITWAWRATE